MAKTTLAEAMGKAASAASRVESCAILVNSLGLRRVAEVGVFRGSFAAALLERCPNIEEYLMIDPWRHQTRWNKPANLSDHAFQACYEEAMAATDFAAGRRKVLRGSTQETARLIEDGSLDFVYIDGDHTLRGITIDLTLMFPKVRPGGVLAGDDLTPGIWQHGRKYEPTLVFPYAVYFAEAQDIPVYALPQYQFAMLPGSSEGFAFHDLAGGYQKLSLGDQLTFWAPILQAVNRNRVLGPLARRAKGAARRLHQRR
jgi:predicted O-methyltransferase YrrM